MMLNNNNSAETKSSTAGLVDNVMKYLRLLVEDTKLNVAEKLTRLLAAVALCAVLLILGIVTLVYISMAVAWSLAVALSPVWSYIIVAGFFVLLLAVLIFFRKQLIENPIARFISRLLLDAPAPKDSQNDTSTLS